MAKSDSEKNGGGFEAGQDWETSGPADGYTADSVLPAITGTGDCARASACRGGSAGGQPIRSRRRRWTSGCRNALTSPPPRATSLTSELET